MPEPYPDDLRMRAVEKAPAGESRRSVAKELRAAASSVIKWARRYSDTGSAGPSRTGTRRAPKLAGCRAWILERIKACPAITPAGLQDWLGGRGVASSLASIWRFPRVCGLTRKKPTPGADERDRPGAQRRRERRKRFQGRADPRKPVFIDETCMKTDMSPRHGRGPKGQRVRGSAPFGHRGTSTFMAALRQDRIDAPRVLDGPADGDAFRAYVETRLVPTPDRGDIVVMDAPGSQKIEAVRAAIRGAGAHLSFLPPCSPDLNPIEQAFAKLKRFLRKDQPRSRDDLWRNVGSILEKFTPQECSNDLANSGCAVGQT